MWIGNEAKAGVVRRFPQNHASAGSLTAQYVEASFDECASYSLSLAARHGGDRTKADQAQLCPSTVTGEKAT